MVPPRGCAYVVMMNRRDASKVLVTLKNERIHGNSLKVCTLSYQHSSGSQTLFSRFFGHLSALTVNYD